MIHREVLVAMHWGKSLSEVLPACVKVVNSIKARPLHTYLCETAFSVLTNMKTKYRSRLAVESDLRVCLTKIVPRIEKLCSEKQPHPSH